MAAFMKHQQGRKNELYYTIQIFTLDGKELIKVSDTVDRKQINLTGYDKGLYLLKVTLNNGSTFYKKIIIQ